MTPRPAHSTPALARLRSLRGWPAFGAATFAGALAAAGLPPLHVWPLTLVGFTGLILLLDGAALTGEPRRAGFARALAFGIGYFGPTLYWIGAPFQQVESARALAPAGFLLPIVLAAFWAGAGAVALSAWTRDWRRVLWFAGVFGMFEWLRGHLFGGLPWALPAYVWPAGGAVSQAAAALGAYGLSVLTVLLFCTPATLFDAQPRAERRAAPTLIAALALGLLWGAGVQRLGAEPLPPQGPVVRVVDSGLSQEEKWAPGAQLRVLERYLDASGGADTAAEIVVWPETAVPVLLLDSPDLLEAVGRALGNRVLISGVIRYEQPEDGPARYRNSAAVLDGVAGSVRIGQVYDKVRLVPFGEFIPLWDLVAQLGLSLGPIQEIGNGYEPGPGPARLVIPGAGAAAPLICYEAIFPGFAPSGQRRADWLVNVTNDAWFSYGPQWPPTGPLQHYAQARFRAIEEGLPLVRAASGGVSAIIDAYGREVAATSWQGGAAEAPLPGQLGETLFTRWGFLIFIGLIMVLLAGRMAPRPRDG